MHHRSLSSSKLILTFSSREEAASVIKDQSFLDPSELQYLLEYYSLVKEGKTNYIATATFHDVTGQHPLEPPEFFKNMSHLLETQADSLNGKSEEAVEGSKGKKRKTNGR
jgi:hypothetical protein